MHPTIFHACDHFELQGGFYSKRQRENDFCLWPCDLYATGGRMTENSISLFPFSRALESTCVA